MPKNETTETERMRAQVLVLTEVATVLLSRLYRHNPNARSEVEIALRDRVYARGGDAGGEDAFNALQEILSSAG